MPSTQRPTRSRLIDANAASAPDARRHTHRIEVETGDEPVQVTVGQAASAAAEKPSPTPGGFCKFFNRVIDTGLWGELPDAARAVYLPLLRLAESRGPCRARAGLAALMRMSGLSRSSVKRGLRALQGARLIVVVRQGGVDANGINRPNVYEMLVPEADATPTSPTSPVQPRTPSRSRGKPTPRIAAEPAVGSGDGRTPVRCWTSSKRSSQTNTLRRRVCWSLR
jgi:hypothetical protein